MNLGLAYWHIGQMHDAEDVLVECIGAERCAFAEGDITLPAIAK